MKEKKYIWSNWIPHIIISVLSLGLTLFNALGIKSQTHIAYPAPRPFLKCPEDLKDKYVYIAFWS